MSSYLYGLNAVSEALAQNCKIRSFWVLRNADNQRLKTLLSTAEAGGISVKRTDRAGLEKLVGPVGHQGVVAQVAERENVGLAELLQRHAGRGAFFLVLDGVTDPHNFGALIRSAAAAGCQAVIFAKDRSCPVTAVVEKAAAGSIAHIALCQVTNLARAIEEIKSAGVWVYGLAGEESQCLFDADLSGELALVAGSEGKGVRPLVRKMCDGLLSIPMPGKIESLNVSVATGVALFEVVRSRLKVKQ
ncbi:MAG: 23S rRNA (guanosine(2251)-2'-O)-methyltransferase RlmB [Desulfuromonas sp.]|nr:23S rRNA (guanosine(2251)-2'-O)-methyltransferase RlmB [Desulfuromonas sp.]